MTLDTVSTFFNRDEVLESYIKTLIGQARLSYLTGGEESGGQRVADDKIPDGLLTLDKLPAEIRETAQTDVDEFMDWIERHLKDYPRLSELTATQIGHDFWLTRNAQETGFWDRGLGALGEFLTQSCEPYGGYRLQGSVILKNPILPHPDILAWENLHIDTLRVWDVEDGFSG